MHVSGRLKRSPEHRDIGLMLIERGLDGSEELPGDVTRDFAKSPASMIRSIEFARIYTFATLY